MSAEALKPTVWRVHPGVWCALVIMLTAAFLADWFTPRHYTADDKPPVKLADMVPKAFGVWQEDPSQAVLLVDPTLQKAIDELYSQTLNRMYVSSNGERVLLSIAYGRNQNSESTAAHRPEFCYSAQGFMVQRVGVSPVALDGHEVQAVRLDAHQGERREPISYWVTLDNEPTLPGWDRKLRQLRHGLQGKIVDGMLVRVSSLRDTSSPDGLESDFQMQDRFLRDMAKAMSPDVRVRFFGK